MTAIRPDLGRKIDAFRARAEEVRAVLENMHDPGARITMLRLAETYEKVARHLEDLHVLGEPTSNAG
jgi:flagellar biosynthesis/type III secretory pathway chaperone